MVSANWGNSLWFMVPSSWFMVVGRNATEFNLKGVLSTLIVLPVGISLKISVWKANKLDNFAVGQP
jgi:hypothetical protein